MTGFVTNVVTEVDVITDVATETEVLTQQVTLPAVTQQVTDVVTQKVTLPAVTDVITQKVTLPAGMLFLLLYYRPYIMSDTVICKVTLESFLNIHTRAKFPKSCLSGTLRSHGSCCFHLGDRCYAFPSPFADKFK